MPFLPALCLLFVLAKLVGLVGWSWWLVFSPVLIPLAFIFALFAIIGIFKLLDK